MNEDQLAAMVGRLTIQNEALRLQLVEVTQKLAEATKPASETPVEADPT